MDLFNGLGVTRLPYIHLLIERKATSQPLTIRRDIGKRCTVAEMEALLAWERVKAEISLKDAQLTPSPHMELRVRHKFQKGEVVPVDYAFVVEHPFRKKSLCQSGWQRLRRYASPSGRPIRYLS